MARGNQRDNAREKAQKALAGQVSDHQIPEHRFIKRKHFYGDMLTHRAEKQEHRFWDRAGEEQGRCRCDYES